MGKFVIKKAKNKNKSSRAVLYTTLEPCLMCLGACVLSRIDKIVFGCLDPRGGATLIKLPPGISFYQELWPRISGGLFQKEIFQIMKPWMLSQGLEQWRKNILLFENALNI